MIICCVTRKEAFFRKIEVKNIFLDKKSLEQTFSLL